MQSGSIIWEVPKSLTDLESTHFSLHLSLLQNQSTPNSLLHIYAYRETRILQAHLTTLFVCLTCQDSIVLFSMDAPLRLSLYKFGNKDVVVLHGQMFIFSKGEYIVSTSLRTLLIW